MDRFTAEDARRTANESDWLRCEIIAQIQFASKHNKAYIQLDMKDVSSIALDNLTCYLVGLGYHTYLDEAKVFTVKW